MPRSKNAPSRAEQRQRIEQLRGINRARSLTRPESDELDRLLQRQANRHAVDRYRLPRQIAAAKARLAALERKQQDISA